MNWTKEQSDAIYKKGSNILVAAAAGSGKTAVLVERIIEKILNDKIDIDKLLVVTFTNAAASEMRERILEAIYKKIDENPDDQNLQRQIILLEKASICTIHSFCLDVIRNNFFELDVPANFRIGSEEEIEILRQEVLEDLFENLYEEENKDFEHLVETYTGYRGDEPLKEMVIKIYKFMQSAPFPKEWLMSKINLFNISEEELNKDFKESIWGRILVNDLKDEIINSINSLKVLKIKVDREVELEKYSLCLATDIDNLSGLYEKLEMYTWDDAYNYSKELKFKTWPQDKKITSFLKDQAKVTRSTIKDKIMKKIKEILVYDSNSAYSDIYQMYDVLKILGDVILKFNDDFSKKKKEKNIIDFNDIEHFALNILVKKNENGNYVATDVAKKYQEKFEEIAIDEYQDSNRVQEFILSKISRGNNLFMVGDVKQSIYKFRLACPELFLEKYENYSTIGNDKGLKIQLFKNFRSRKNVLDVTNVIFENIMGRTLGDIEYNENEYLNLGADYEEISDGVGNAELDILNLKDEAPSIWKDDEEVSEAEEEKQDEESNHDEKIIIEKNELEAKFVAKRIEELISSKKMIKDKKLGYRSITYKDIVILLRSTSNVAPIFEKELIKKNIPVFSDSSNEYLDTIEIQTMISVLKVLDNPLDDISLVAVLRSKVGNFTDNEITKIRLVKRDGYFYDSLILAKENLDDNLKSKVIQFLNLINTWKNEIKYLSLSELIWKIFTDTGFFNYVGLMPNGAIRQANLKMLFERAKDYEKTSFKGLYNFIGFVTRLRNSNNDMQAAKIIGENENVVRIMSIHKSKGLEFPIVFLSNTSKKINMQDLNSNLLLHQNVGIGPQYINYDKKVEYSTSSKDAIKILIRNENISEEMRILYVALTRAKEKLIITGTCKDYQKDISEKEELLNVYEDKDGKINPSILKKYISYLDWIEFVYLKSNSKLHDLITIKEFSKKDIVEEEIDNEEEKLLNLDILNKEKIDEFNKEFSWKYKDEFLTTLPLKSTVSKVKEIKNNLNEIDFEDLNNKNIGFAEILPEFLSEDKITSSKKGTLMHLVLEKLDFRRDYNYEQLKNILQDLVYKNIISGEEEKVININKILNFFNSNLYKKIKSSKQIEKEKAFCTKINASEIYEEAKDEKILVQGIIDLYFIDSDNQIILVDYKTDFVENNDEESLINKYKVQLLIYKKALEEATGLKVKDTYIYSLYLNKEIKL